MRSRSLFAFLLVAFLCAPIFAQAPAEQLEFFERKIRPVLVEHCYKCHSSEAKKPKGGLLLDSRAGLLKGGDNGPALVPGHPERSKLIEAVLYKNVDLQMPPRAKLPEALIADLSTWIKTGAFWPVENPGKTATDKFALDLARRKKEHWAWRGLQAGPPPRVKNEAWSADPVDRFVLAKLEEKGLSPSGPADTRTLIRRLSFDLTGLPPTPEEVSAFLRECGERETVNQVALEKLVDRLLASPHFGERWGRHWLDLVRYAESRGHEFDYNLPNAYQYRDYVIRALNADVPYDRFVLEHLAGDLLPEPRLHPVERFDEALLGTGFWFLGEQVHSPVDTCQDRADRQDNMIDVMTKTFLGLTVSCARCHDHKFDAISTKDYYALLGFLESSGYRLAGFDTLHHNRPIAEELWRFRRDAPRPILETLSATLGPGMTRLPDYLLAVREVHVDKAPIDDVARKHNLDAALLARWHKYLAGPANDPRDALHVWAKAALHADAKDPNRLRERMQAKQASHGEPKGVDVIIDYATSRGQDWLQDGFAFGPKPVRVGEVQLGPKPEQPVRIALRGAALADPIFGRMKLAADTENEPGALGRLVRSGRTLRTPTFALKTGRIFSLVRGSGMAYASVDGHVMIAGPLHGQLVVDFKVGPEFRWIAHDLTRYKGSRGHLEFTPAEGSDFAVAMVVQGEQAPALPDTSEPIAPVLAKDAGSLEALAEAYRRLFTHARLGLLSEPVSHPTLADWLVRHADLFANPEEVAKKLADVAGPIFENQARIAARLRTHSRLAPAMFEGTGVDENVFIRGNYKTPGDVAPRRFLEALAGPESLAVRRGSGRLELARHLVDPSVTPFVPRVQVNRIWHHLFGRGIVSSVDNFGVLGEAPTHPELLDFLADRFVKDGWSVKKTIRMLVLSQTYRMAAHPDSRAMQVDPQNLWLHHARVRRLEGEAIRDALLQVSGRLDRRQFGPSVPVHLTEFQEGRGRPASGPLDGNGRRSVYLSVRRNFLPAMLLAFDTPIPFSSVGRRTVSNVPAQALILLNDPFVHQQAAGWAKNVVAQKDSSRDRITAMYLTAFSRPPTEGELTACLEFLEKNADANELAVWTDLAHVLVNAKEFVFLN